jgi:hypothetical protein
LAAVFAALENDFCSSLWTLSVISVWSELGALAICAATALA